MMRCHIPPGGWGDEEIALSPEESRHLLSARRAGRDEILEVFDGNGVSASARIAGVASGRAVLRIEAGSRRVHPRRPVEFVMFHALLKSAAMEWMLQKTAEIGADEVVPVLCARSVPRPPERESKTRRARWENIVLGSAKQCGSNFLTRVAPVMPFENALSRAAGFDLMVLCSTNPAAPSFRRIAAVSGGKPLKRVAIFVGPEGDFTAEETAAAVSAGARPASLGTNILRAETAAVCALCLALNEFAPAAAG